MTDITLRAPAQPAPESQLVRVFAGTIGGIPANVCDARELHAYLENGDLFANWIKARVEKYGFKEDQDFAIALAATKAKRGGHNRIDYHLSLDMAKELSMVENNERGREARRYFIQKEREALAALGQHVPVPHTETLLPSEQQTLAEIVQRKTERYGQLQGKALAEAWSRLHRKFRVAKYSQLPRTQLADAILYITQMELRTAGGDIPPQAAREMISNRDQHAIRRVIYFISNRFGHRETWTQGIWAHLRATLDNPSPQPFYVDQLPRIAETLALVMRDAQATSDLIVKIQQDAVRRILRKGEPADTVLADLARDAGFHHAQCQQLLPDLPTWFANDIRAIVDRTMPVHFAPEGAAEAT